MIREEEERWRRRKTGAERGAWRRTVEAWMWRSWRIVRRRMNEFLWTKFLCCSCLLFSKRRKRERSDFFQMMKWPETGVCYGCISKIREQKTMRTIFQLSESPRTLSSLASASAVLELLPLLHYHPHEHEPQNLITARENSAQYANWLGVSGQGRDQKIVDFHTFAWLQRRED